MATSKKRKAPRAPFIVTVAAVSAVSVAVAPGCGPSVSGGACPEAEPASGSSCPEDGQVCGYSEDACGYSYEYTCNGGVWEDSGLNGTCNPPWPVCPDSVPAHMSPCDQLSQVCSYPGDGACVFGYTATCSGDFFWSVEEDVGSCNPPGCPADLPEQGAPCEPTWEEFCTYTVDTGCGPMDAQATCVNGAWSVATVTCNPPPPEYCYTLGTEAECAGLDPFCRWLVPGCADPGAPPPPLSQAGCFPSYDCISSAECPTGTACAEVVYDPCYNQPCDACGAVAMLCTAP